MVIDGAPEKEREERRWSVTARDGSASVDWGRGVYRRGSALPLASADPAAALDQAYRRHVEDFLHSCRTGAPTACPLAAGLDALRACDAARRLSA